jgi:signal transduction histidine kinase
MRVSELLMIFYLLLILFWGMAQHYIPLRKHLRIPPKYAAYLGGWVLLIFTGVCMAFPILRTDLPSGAVITVLFHFILIVPSALFLLRGCVLQTLFVASYHLCLAAFILGLGNWLAFWASRLFASDLEISLILIRIAVILLLLPLSLRLLDRIIAAWSIPEATPMWRVAWLVPIALFFLSILSGNVWTLDASNSLAFLFTRLCSVTALLTWVNMMTGFIHREQDTASARTREEWMLVASKAHDQSHAETLRVLEALEPARSEAITAVERILTHLDSGDHDAIKEILRDRKANLETMKQERICDNEAVNALAVYYANLAKIDGIEISYKLDIPKQAGHIQNIDLSRIVGNMLENALEASRRVYNDNKHIRLNAMVQGDMLVFGMQNSFDGQLITRPDGLFVSRKRSNGVATGLSSIQAIAHKYHGSVKFSANNLVFHTLVRLDMAGFIT